MEKINEQIETIYKELLYIDLEFTLLKEIDNSLIEDKNSLRSIEIMSFIVIDSLWYAIIMRISKIWDKHTDSKSLLKILNKIESVPEMKELRDKISLKRICDIKEKVNSIMEDIDINGEISNLFIKSRHNYFAHLGDFNSPQQAQNKYLIGRNRLDKIIDILLEIVEELCYKLNVKIAKNDFEHKLDILSNLEYPYFIKSINNEKDL